MAITRNDALAYLQGEYETLLAQTDLATTDTADGLKPPIDLALRKLGTAGSDLPAASVSDDDALAYYALLDYYTLQRLARHLATKVDPGLTNVDNRHRDRMFQNLETLITMAAEQCAGYGYPVDGSASWSFDGLNLDFIEPEPCA